MNWALERRVFYLLILFAILAIFGFFVIYPYFNKAPTCADGRQNGQESGVDCGGSCPIACVAELDSISVLWSRAFKVLPGRYNAVAYIENHNDKAAVEKINYRFRFADKDNIYIGKREGSTLIPPGGRFAIFEPAVDMGNSIPIYTSFEFTEAPLWIQVPEDKLRELKIVVSDVAMTDSETSPKLSGTIKNDSIFIIPNLNVVAILYDAAGNAISTSRTYLSNLTQGEARGINFTWPEPFTEETTFREIIPMYDIFEAKLR